HLQNTDLNVIFDISDPNLAAETLTYAIINSIKINTIILLVPRSRRILKPWITIGLLRCIRNRDQMHLKLKKTPHNEILKITYTRYRNYCNSTLRNLKIAYEKSELEKAGNNSKLMWQKIKYITNTTKKKTSPIELLSIESDPSQAVDRINEDFASIGKNLTLEIMNSHNLDSEKQKYTNLSTITPNSIVLLETTENEIDPDRTWVEACSLAEHGVDVVSKWLNCNLLTLNLDKTKFMAFTITNSTKPPNDFKLKVHNCDQALPSPHCNCLEIKRTDELRYLGVIVDDLCKCNSHIELIFTRVRKLSWVFKKFRHVANYDLILIVYKAVCLSVIQYCISVWGGTHKTYLLPLERAQRRILKVMLFKPFRYPISQLYNECK
ncbi:Uncharacterized protein OBRU01_11332, partial [Operophtera brumata]